MLLYMIEYSLGCVSQNLLILSLTCPTLRRLVHDWHLLTSHKHLAYKTAIILAKKQEPFSRLFVIKPQTFCISSKDEDSYYLVARVLSHQLLLLLQRIMQARSPNWQIWLLVFTLNIA